MISNADAHNNGSCHWYAVYLRTRYEKRTHQQLQQKGVESFLPLIEEVHVWSDRRKKVLEPLFRGYVFVHTDLQNRLNVLQTEGVIRFVGIRNIPSPIPEEQIMWVKTVVGIQHSVRREPHIVSGDAVRVIAGPLHGLRGIATRVKNSTRVVIVLSEIQQAFSVEVAPEFLARS
jgi:transcription antitermination factor NusG